MNLGSALRAACAFAILVLLNYTLRPLLPPRAEVDFLVIAVLLGAVRMRPGYAAVLGLFVGLAADSINPAGFGSGALALTGVAFAASWLKAVFFADNAILNGLFFFAGRLIFVVIQLIAEHRVGGAELVVQLMWGVLSAAVTAIAGVLLVLLMRPLLEPSPA